VAKQSINKEAFIESMAKISGLTKTDANKALNAFIQAVGKALKSGKEVRLIGFGTFGVTASSARAGRNPRTGQAIKIPASKRPKFKAGAVLKRTIS
jgi:DNA-binding protein HU-beta